MTSPTLVPLDLACKVMIYDLRTQEFSVFQHGGDFFQKVCEALVPFRILIPFVATQQTTAEEPRRSARFDTVSHS
jgi:hypothetical protein